MIVFREAVHGWQWSRRTEMINSTYCLEFQGFRADWVPKHSLSISLSWKGRVWRGQDGWNSWGRLLERKVLQEYSRLSTLSDALLVSDEEGDRKSCSAEEAGREQSYWLQRSGMATRERCTNYNNEEGHEYLNEWPLWLCNSIWSSFQVYKEGIIMFDFRKKETKPQRNNLPMVTQANNW